MTANPLPETQRLAFIDEYRELQIEYIAVDQYLNRCEHVLFAKYQEVDDIPEATDADEFERTLHSAWRFRLSDAQFAQFIESEIDRRGIRVGGLLHGVLRTRSAVCVAYIVRFVRLYEHILRAVRESLDPDNKENRLFRNIEFAKTHGWVKSEDGITRLREFRNAMVHPSPLVKPQHLNEADLAYCLMWIETEIEHVLDPPPRDSGPDR